MRGNFIPEKKKKNICYIFAVQGYLCYFQSDKDAEVCEIQEWDFNNSSCNNR